MTKKISNPSPPPDIYKPPPPPDPPAHGQCVTHHAACDCREARAARMEQALAVFADPSKWELMEAPGCVATWQYVDAEVSPYDKPYKIAQQAMEDTQ